MVDVADWRLGREVRFAHTHREELSEALFGKAGAAGDVLLDTLGKNASNETIGAAFRQLAQEARDDYYDSHPNEFDPVMREIEHDEETEDG